MIELGGSAVEQDGERLSTYLPKPAAASATAVAEARAIASLAELPGIDAPDISVTAVEDRDWLAEWRSGLAPRRVGKRLIVAPTWADPDAEPTDIILRVDPQMAFGTGEHASTRGVLRLLERVVKAGDVMLDAGTGSGILAIAAARLGAARVIAIDNDADALINARENVEANGVAAVIRIEHASIDGAFLEASGTRFDVIAANVLSGVLLPLLPGFAAYLAAGGALLLGGILVEESDLMLDAAGKAGLIARAADREDGWWSVWLARP